jgi:hypothetical protein
MMARFIGFERADLRDENRWSHNVMTPLALHKQPGAWTLFSIFSRWVG